MINKNIVLWTLFCLAGAPLFSSPAWANCGFAHVSIQGGYQWDINAKSNYSILRAVPYLKSAKKSRKALDQVHANMLYRSKPLSLEVQELLLNISEENKYDETRCHAAYIVQTFGVPDPQTLDRLLAVLRVEKNPSNRDEIAEGFYYISRPEVFATKREAVANISPAYPAIVRQKLREIGLEILQWKTKDHRHEREAAVRILAEHAQTNPELIAKLGTIANIDPDSQVRYLAQKSVIWSNQQLQQKKEEEFWLKIGKQMTDAVSRVAKAF